ncbi:MAG TPA: AIR synthase-related protein, partial [Acidimicrobiales bacterium]|nr:AIR synthase-related protein [Acidimicrobiales bacterium]
GHARLCTLVRDLVGEHLLAGVHDVSDGGLAVALAEMAIASGVGFHVSGVDGHGGLFSEAPSRVVVCVGRDEEAVIVAERAADAGLAAARLGVAGGDRMVVEGLLDVSLEEARNTWRGALRGTLGGPTPQGA